jgi:hypothetical protein
MAAEANLTLYMFDGRLGEYTSRFGRVRLSISERTSADSCEPPYPIENTHHSQTLSRLLSDPPGTGKTMLAVALGITAIEAGHRVLFLTLETLITRLRRAQAENAGMAARTMDHTQSFSGGRAGLSADEP